MTGERNINADVKKYIKWVYIFTGICFAILVLHIASKNVDLPVTNHNRNRGEQKQSAAENSEPARNSFYTDLQGSLSEIIENGADTDQNGLNAGQITQNKVFQHQNQKFQNVLANLTSEIFLEAMKYGYRNEQVEQIFTDNDQNINSGNNDKKELSIIVGIVSRIGKSHEILRKAQRKTWLKRIAENPTLSKNFKYKFVLSIESKNLDPEIITESDFYNDMIFIETNSEHADADNIKNAETVKAWFKYAKENFPDIDIIGRASDRAWVCPDLIYHELSQFYRDDYENVANAYYAWAKTGFKEDRSVGKPKNELGMPTAGGRRQDELFYLLGRNLVTSLLSWDYCNGPQILPESEEERDLPKFTPNNRPCLRKLPKFDTLPFKGPYNRRKYTTTHFSLWLEDLSHDMKISKYPESERMLYAMKNNIPDYCHTYTDFENGDVHRILLLDQKYENHKNGLGNQGSATSGKLFGGSKDLTYMENPLPNLQAPKNIKNYLKNTDNCKKFAVVTTIFEATDAVKNVASMKDWCIVIVADLKSKSKKAYGVEGNNVIYLEVNDQVDLYPHLSNIIPWNHFGRKNIGYMFAIDAGAELVWDFDDDNDGMVDEMEVKNNLAEVCERSNEENQSFAINPYMHFGVNETISWARGFPLDLILSRKTYQFETCSSEIDKNSIAVIQSLANKQPDVDDLVIPKYKYTPFNAQATLWTDNSLDTLALLMLPITVHGRVADIWRSYFTQWIFHNTNKYLIFSKPYVIQDRNVHNYLADFNSEHDLYFKSSRLVEILANLEYDKDKSVKENLIRLYVEMYERNIIYEKDVELVKVWLQHVYVYRR